MRNPDQYLAEEKLHTQARLAKKQASAEALSAKIQAAGEVHFVHEGRVFVPAFKKIIVPHLGTRTALELCCDEEAQAYLLSTAGCVGSVIKEIK